MNYEFGESRRVGTLGRFNDEISIQKQSKCLPVGLNNALIERIWIHHTVISITSHACCTKKI